MGKITKSDQKKIDNYLSRVGHKRKLSDEDTHLFLAQPIYRDYQYFIFILMNGKIKKCIHRDYNLLRTYKRLHTLTKYNKLEVDFEQKYITFSFIRPVLYELVVCKRFNYRKDSKLVLKDEIGRFYVEPLLANRFLRLAKKKYLIEETFNVYPHNPLRIRFNINNIYYSYLIKNINEDEIFKSVTVYNHMVIINHDTNEDNPDLIDIIICKNIHDSLRLHDKLIELVHTRGDVSNPLKVMFINNPKGQYRMQLREMIMRKTNWTQKRMTRKTTKNSPW